MANGESIFDILAPEPEQGLGQRAVRAASDTFAAILPSVLQDEEAGFGSTFLASLGANLSGGARQQEAQRAERRTEGLQFAGQVFDKLDTSSQQSLLGSLAPGLAFKEVPDVLSPEQKARREVLMDLAIKTEGPAQAAALEALGTELGDEFDPELLTALREAKTKNTNPIGLVNKRALAILDSMEDDDQFSDLPKSQQGVLEMADIKIAGVGAGSAKEGREQLITNEFKQALGRRNLGEPALPGDEAVINKFLGAGPRDNRIQILQSIDKAAETATFAQDLPRAAFLQDQAAQLRDQLLNDALNVLEAGEPVVDPSFQAILFDEFLNQNPDIVTQGRSMVRNAASALLNDEEALNSPEVKAVIERQLQLAGTGLPPALQALAPLGVKQFIEGRGPQVVGQALPRPTREDAFNRPVGDQLPQPTQFAGQ